MLKSVAGGIPQVVSATKSGLERVYEGLPEVVKQLFELMGIILYIVVIVLFIYIALFAAVLT